MQPACAVQAAATVAAEWTGGRPGQHSGAVQTPRWEAGAAVEEAPSRALPGGGALRGQAWRLGPQGEPA